MKTFWALIKVQNFWGVDTLQEVLQSAASMGDAQRLIEAKYGFGSVCNIKEQL